jgi:hypothetical protein
MAYWEFLIQKEGDYTWLPLESPEVEILEGRYRVVARSSRIKTPVEIRLTHDLPYENPPKRRIRKRSGQTNGDGLVVVIPFTRLEAGTWELRCTGDVMSDMMGDGWHHRVVLHVLSHSVQDDESLSPDGDDAVTSDQAFTMIADHDSAIAPMVTPVDAQLDSLDEEAQIALQNVSPADALRSVTTEPSRLNSEAISEVMSEPAQPNPLEDEAFEAAATSQDGDLDAGVANLLTEMAVALDRELDEELDGEDDFASFLSEDGEPLVEVPELDIPDSVEASIDVNQEDVLLSALNLEDEGSEHSPLPPRMTTPPLGVDDAVVDSPLEDSPEAQPVASEVEDSTSADPSHPVFAIALKADPIRWTRGRAITVEGQIEAIAPTCIPGGAYWLSLTLSDPQTGEVVLAETLRLAASGSDATLTFCGEFQSLREAHTHLLLGDIAVYPGGDRPANVAPWASQSFTVTMDLHALLNALANEANYEDVVEAPLEFTTLNPPTMTPDLTFLDLVNRAEPLPPFQILERSPLPPKLYEPQPAPTSEPKARLLDLPSFGNPLPSRMEALSTVYSEAQAATESLSEAPEATSVESESPEVDVDHSRSDQANFDSIEAAVAEATVTDATLASPDVTPDADSEVASITLTDEEMLASSDVERVEPLPNASAPASPFFTLRADAPSDSAPPSITESLLESDATAAVVESLLDAAPMPGRDRPALELPSQPFPSGVAAASLSPEEAAFQSLNLHHRFVSRLTALASDRELSTWLQSFASLDAQEHTTLEAALEAQAEPASATAKPTTPMSHPILPFSHEIVVDDEDGRSASPPQTRSPIATAPEPSPTATLTLEEEAEPLPVPTLEVVEDELIAGDRANVIVQLPIGLESWVHVKLWIRDRQARTVLDGPHWVSNFLPNQRGQLEARTQVTVPFGCLEVQFEAIAVELTTRRESHKVVLTRFVLPPDSPEFGLEDLNL